MNGLAPATGKVKLSEFIELFFNDYAASALKAKTVVGYAALVPVTMKSGLNSDFSRTDSIIDSISLDFYAISRLFAFMYSSATARCSSLYFLNTEQ